MKTKYFILIAVLALFCACKGNTNYELAKTGDSADADTSMKDLMTRVDVLPKLVKATSLQFKVKNVSKTGQKIETLTRDMGGLVMHQQTSSEIIGSEDIGISHDSIMRVTSLSTKGEMTVKVPSVKLGAFIDSVAAMGLYVTSRSMDITDKTLDYLSAQMKLKSRSELISEQKSGKVIIKDPTKVLNLSDDMIDQQIENRQIDDDVKNSVVNLSFYQSNTINKEVVVNDDPSAYEQPFFNRFIMACQNGWSLFIDLIIALANIWFLVLAGLGVWLFIRYKKKNSGVKTIHS